MPRRPALKCRTNRVLCPDPTCRRVQRAGVGFDQSGRWRGRGIGVCSCGVEFWYHAADGVVEVLGLWPGEADQVDPDAPLAETLKRLGLMEAA